MTSDGAAIYKGAPDPPGVGLVIVVVDNLYKDACHPLQGVTDPPLGPSVDDLAAALASQPTTPTDVTLRWVSLGADG